jgi:Tfp pilus assembly protein PilV
MMRVRGFALFDGLLALLALGVVLSPMLVMQTQVRHDLDQSTARTRALLVAVSLAELQLAEPLAATAAQARTHAASLALARVCAACRQVSVTIQAYPNPGRSLVGYEVKVSWQDPVPQVLRIMALGS